MEQLLPDDFPSTPLSRAKFVANLLDDAVDVPIPLPIVDLKIGLDPLLTAIPGGKLVSGIISMYIVFEGYLAGVPWYGLGLMTLLVAIDVAIGLIPLIGLVFDAVWRANSWNVSIIERYGANWRGHRRRSTF